MPPPCVYFAAGSNAHSLGVCKYVSEPGLWYQNRLEMPKMPRFAAIPAVLRRKYRFPQHFARASRFPISVVTACAQRTRNRRVPQAPRLPGPAATARCGVFERRRAAGVAAGASARVVCMHMQKLPRHRIMASGVVRIHVHRNRAFGIRTAWKCQKCPVLLPFRPFCGGNIGFRNILRVRRAFSS